MKKRRKNSREKRALIGAVCTAAVILAGSTFAWFTSTDEVTNRLTASADYGVSIVEDFNPPQDMTPGQKVNKDVSAVNTGNIDALVRLALEHEIDYSKLTATALSVTKKEVNETYSNASGDTATVATATDITSGSYTLGSQTAPNGYPNYLYSTYKFTITAPSASGTNSLVKLDPREYVDANGNLHANEVTTLQAGGTCVVAASQSVAPTSEFPVRSGDDTNSGTSIDIIYKLQTAVIYDTSKNTNYVYYDSSASKYYAVVANTDGTYTKTNNETSDVTSATITADTTQVIGVTEDYSGVLQYKPATAGLYIFRRSADITGTGASAEDNENATYSGYYYDGSDFYALETDDKKVTLKAGTENGKAVETDANGIVNKIDVKYLVEEKGIMLNKTGASVTSELESVTYTADTGVVAARDTSVTTKNAIKVTVKSTSDDATPVIFHILLAEEFDSSNKSKNWTYVDSLKDAAEGVTATVPAKANGFGYFYYNKPLAAGETSAKLVDAVVLDSTMTSANFLNLTYDLNVLLNSIQVTKDEYNNEVATTNVGWATPTATNKTGTTPTQIDSVAWATPIIN